MRRMTNLFSSEIVPVESLEYYIYEQEGDLEVPPAFVYVIMKVEKKYETNDSKVVGCVSYYPDNIHISWIPTELNALIYVVRLKTSLRNKVDNKIQVSKTRQFDIYVYSNPLLHIYTTLRIAEVCIDDWTIRAVRLLPEDLNNLYGIRASFLCSTYVKMMDTISIEKVRKPGVPAELLAAPRLSNRDIWDLLSLFYQRLSETIGDYTTPGTVGSLDPHFPSLVPLFNIHGISGRHIYIVRCLELETAKLYDVYFKACIWNTKVDLCGLLPIPDIYSEFVPNSPQYNTEPMLV